MDNVPDSLILLYQPVKIVLQVQNSHQKFALKSILKQLDLVRPTVSYIVSGISPNPLYEIINEITNMNVCFS